MGKMTETITGAQFLDMLTGNAGLGKPQKKSESRETSLSIEVANAFDRWRMEGRFIGVAFHVANEVPASVLKMKPYNAQKFWQKRAEMGIVSGAPDWVVMWRGGGCLIELKAPRTTKIGKKGGLIQDKPMGTLSDSQKLFQAECEATGVMYTVCYDIGQVERDLIMFGGLK